MAEIIPLNHTAKAFADARAIGNPDIEFGRRKADLNDWLNRGDYDDSEGLYAFVASLRPYLIGGSVGFIVGAFVTCVFALVWGLFL